MSQENCILYALAGAASLQTETLDVLHFCRHRIKYVPCEKIKKVLIGGHLLKTAEGVCSENFFERLALQKSVEIMARLMPTSIAVLDEDFRIHYINETITKMLGFTLEEACTKRCYELTDKPGVCPNCAAQ